MSRNTMRNLHVPLPEPLYEKLKAQAERAQRPATEIAREAIDRWLAETHRAEIHEEIAGYASAVAGTDDDLDPELEAAAIEHLVGVQKVRKRTRR